jgi:hypothetical protein
VSGWESERIAWEYQEARVGGYRFGENEEEANLEGEDE